MTIGFRSNKKDNIKKIAPLLNIPLLLAMASLCIVVLPLRAGSVSLGDAAGFAVLADATLTNTGPTTLIGDLGVSPGTAITGFPPGTYSGTIHTNDALAISAQLDAVTAYNQLSAFCRSIRSSPGRIWEVSR